MNTLLKLSVILTANMFCIAERQSDFQQERLENQCYKICTEKNGRMDGQCREVHWRASFDLWTCVGGFRELY